MPSVIPVAERIQRILTSLTTLDQKISKAYTKYIQTVTTGSTDDILLQKEFVSDYNSKTDMYNRLFEEQEAKFQKSGGRKRGNTIQEYVITIFFVGLLIFAVSLSIYVGYMENSTNAGWKTFGMMFLVIFVSACLIVSYG